MTTFQRIAYAVVVGSLALYFITESLALLGLLPL